MRTKGGAEIKVGTTDETDAAWLPSGCEGYKGLLVVCLPVWHSLSPRRHHRDSPVHVHTCCLVSFPYPLRGPARP